jgi:putative addiction module component (TIGR02574 family)
MTITLQQFGIDKLSIAERLELIEKIWDSLPEQIAPDEVPAWHLAILAERRAQAEAQPGLGKPWDEVFARLKGRS